MDDSGTSIVGNLHVGETIQRTVFDMSLWLASFASMSLPRKSELYICALK